MTFQGRACAGAASPAGGRAGRGDPHAVARRPGGDGVGNGGVAWAPALFEEFAVGVAADPGDAVTGIGQQIGGLGRLRAGRDVTGEHDTVGGAHIRLGGHGLQGGEHCVDAGQDGCPARYAPRSALFLTPR